MEVLKFSDDNLAKSLSNNYTPEEVIKSKNHFRYLKGYLSAKGLDAKTIVIESDYISKDYLHDYASYYAYCFEKYPKFCKRIHFFDIEFSLQEFQSIILSSVKEKEDFWKHYLGFIVVKPIPVTIIGYTVLKTYSGVQEFNSRNFWGIRDYSIHLFGNKVQISSLAFQEQDSVLAACATTAIWSMLNKAAADFHTILKSPSEITKDADTVSPDGSRLFPNKGLNLLQICQAIFNSGLVSEIKQPDYPIFNEEGIEESRCISNQYLKKIISAYSPIGIPIILVIKVPNGLTSGLHAITVSGYKQHPPKAVAVNEDVSWLSDNIEKFYAHDDQWGPFTRIDFIGDYELDTPWTAFHKEKRTTLVTNVVVSIYPKIRINYEDIEVIVLGLDTILSIFFKDKVVGDLVWDIKIDYSENFKETIKKSSLPDEDKIAINTRCFPKYLWLATCYIGEHKLFDFSFDATDVSNGMVGEDVICYIPAIKLVLHDFLNLNAHLLSLLFKHRASANYYQYLITQLQK